MHVESLGYPCNNAATCVACRTCCLGAAGEVRSACETSGGTYEYCTEQFEATDAACRAEDCPGC